MPLQGSRLIRFVTCAWALGRTPTDKAVIFWKLTKNVRARLGLAAYHPAAVYELSTRYGPVFLRDNFGDVTNLPDLLHRPVYRVSTLSIEGAILDVGANIGLFAFWMARHNPGRSIYCFEPLSANARLVRRNCPSAVVSQIGLGRERQTATMQVDPHELMASSIPTEWPTEARSFEIHPLDSFARDHGIDRVAFMKIDTEGMEVDVLDGGRETLRRTMAVAMETHGPERHRASLELLLAAGLSVDAEECTRNRGLIFASRSA
jgi:FkbM family methyltransferase